ncbi:MAG: Trm112 family protein [Candidatus Aureabacteria bacterium]|nr:Trm112 family protein [Candidatus Auribacterota bacterium]
MIDKELLDILACPACKADVKLEDEKIVCTQCGRRYPIRDGIPIMLIDEAEVPEAKSK